MQRHATTLDRKESHDSGISPLRVGVKGSFVSQQVTRNTAWWKCVGVGSVWLHSNGFHWCWFGPLVIPTFVGSRPW